jgi:hypothetical protein
MGTSRGGTFAAGRLVGGSFFSTKASRGIFDADPLEYVTRAQQDTAKDAHEVLVTAASLDRP